MAPRSPPEESRSTTRAFDDDYAPLYTVGQVADMLDVQPAFLRRLDAEAVVQPARSGGGQRRYTRLDIHIVERVVTLVGEGLTLAGIRRLLVLEDRVRDLQRQLDEKQVAEIGGHATNKDGLARRRPGPRAEWGGE